MAVLARAEIDLRHPLEPDGAFGVDQHRDLDPVADREREPLEQRARRGHLARERLAEPRELGEVQIEVRAREQLGDAAAAVGVDRVADAVRSPEVALDEVDGRGQQRADQAADERVGEVLGVGVQERDELARGGCEAAPHRVALAEHGRVEICLRDHRRAVPAGECGGPVARVGVDDEYLVHERVQGCDRVEDPADRGRDFARGEDDADRAVLGGEQSVRAESPPRRSCARPARRCGAGRRRARAGRARAAAPKW